MGSTGCIGTAADAAGGQCRGTGGPGQCSQRPCRASRWTSLTQRWLAAIMVVASVALTAAQTTTGSMSGTVVDDSGQVIPGATVSIVSTSGESRTAVTNDVGAFLFSALPPGPYTIRVEMEGFGTLEITGRVVQANNRLAVGELKLEVGELVESVSVTARGENVATSTTSHQAVMDLKQVENLSIRGRDPISLLKILPGVQQLANDQEVFGGSFATPVPQIQGGRGQTLYVDGINAGDSGGGANFGGATNMDAIQEVNIQLSTYTAEYGLKGGAQVNFVTKRGTADYHGTLYTYQRFTGLNATPFLNNRDNVPKPEYRFSTIGGNLGGPIPRVPRVNGDGKKLFFFYSVDDTRLKNPQVLRRYTMPTALERAGDYSQTRTTNGALVVVRDPLTGLPFPDNKIPADRADPRGLALMNLLPMPNAQGAGFNYVYQEDSIKHPRRQHLLRLDYRPTSRDSFSVKGSTWFTNSVGHNVAAASSTWGLVRQRYDFTADQLKFDYTRILGSNTVVEAGFGKFFSTELGPPEDERALAGIQRTTYPALANLPQFAGVHNPLNLIPKVTFGTLQTGSFESPDIKYDNRWPLTGADTALMGVINLTHTRGAHTFKVGMLREHERFTQARSGIFGGEFNVSNVGDDPTNSGFAFANLYLGHVTNYTESMGRRPDNRWQTNWAWFVQDTWKPTAKLTLDLGLRMYKWSSPVSTTGEASTFSFDRFDPTWGGTPPVLYTPVLTQQGRRALNPLTGQISPATFIGQMVPGTGYTCGVIVPERPCEINGVVVQNNGDYVSGGVGFVESPGLLYDPRFGFAYAINRKTVVRGGLGVFHDGTGGPSFRGGPAFEFNRVVYYSDMSSFLQESGPTSITSVTGIERDGYEQPRSYKYQIGFERELPANIVVNLAYVGDTTRNLPQDWNYNQIPAGAQFLPENRDPSLPDSATIGLQPNKPNPGALPEVFLRPIRGLGDIIIQRTTGRSRYDSMQLQVSRRFAGTFELAGSYTYAKGSEMQLRQNNPVSSWRQPSLTVQPHVAVISYIVDLPKGSSVIPWGPAKWVVDDWRISGISTFATGAWSDVTATYTDNFNFAGGGETCGSLTTGSDLINRGLLVQTGDANLDGGERSFARWFDTSVFQRPAARGDVGNNCNQAKVLLPGFHNHDLSIFKDFRAGGNRKFQLRWEIYNVFNHPQWSTVDTTAQFNAAGQQTDPAFGTVTGVRTERRMQVSVRFQF